MTFDVSPALLGPICAFCSSLTWAIGSAGYSRLSRTYSGFAINFTRAALVFPLFLLTGLFMAGGLQEGIAQFGALRATHLGWLTLAMLASYGLGDVLFMWSTRSLGVSGALAIASCYPLWTALAGFFFQGEALSIGQGLGLLLAVVGIGVVILNSPRNGKGASVGSSDQDGAKGKWRSSGLSHGLILALLTSFFWSLHSFAVARGGKDLTLAVGNSVRMGIAILLSMICGRIFEPKMEIYLPFKEIQKSFWLFVLEAFVGSSLFFYGLSHSPLAIGSTLSALAPVISVPAAWLLKLEKFSLYRTLGVCLVVFGVVLLLSGF